MEYRKIDKLGVSTSVLGFGCMRLPQTPDGRIDEAETERMIDKAFAAGVNYYDTAYPYHGGESENVVGRIMKKYDRSSFYLATKLPIWLVKTEEDVDRLFEEQRSKLQTDYFDFYLLHALNKERWELIKSLGIVDKMVERQKKGQIKFLGFSFHDSYDVFEEILTYRDWDFCQIQYNYMDCDTQATTKGYALAKERNVPLVIMEPIKGGTLAGFSDDINAMIDQVEKGKSCSSVALRWVACHDQVKVILSGMSNMEQLEDNLDTFEEFVPLSDEEYAMLRDVRGVLETRVKNGCTGCRYCMPCPKGVYIPESFSAWNTYHMYRSFGVIAFDWNAMGDAHQPKNCVECGLCESQCPQHIPVREHLKQVQIDLDAAKAAK